MLVHRTALGDYFESYVRNGFVAAINEKLFGRFVREMRRRSGLRQRELPLSPPRRQPRHMPRAGRRRPKLYFHDVGYFYRDSSELEVDLIYPRAGRLLPIEIKAAQTVSRSQTAALEKFARLFPVL